MLSLSLRVLVVLFPLLSASSAQLSPLAPFRFEAFASGAVVLSGNPTAVVVVVVAVVVVAVTSIGDAGLDCVSADDDDGVVDVDDVDDAVAVDGCDV